MDARASGFASGFGGVGSHKEIKFLLMQLPDFRPFVTCLCFLAAILGVRAETNYATPYYFFTYAGWPSNGSADGPAELAQFNSPNVGAIDRAGNVYVCDSTNHTIRKISAAGEVTTLAGLALHPGSKDGKGPEARFNDPRGLALDSQGNIYVADFGNHVIRKITPAGAVTTIAGTATLKGYVDGSREEARFNAPTDVTVDPAGTIYVADAINQAIRVISPLGNVTTLTGSGYGPLDSYACNSIKSDGSGNLYISDYNGIVTKIPASGSASVLFRTVYDHTLPLYGFGFNAMAVDPAGTVYLNFGRPFDSNRSIMKVRAIDAVESLASIGPESVGLAVDQQGNFYYSDRHTIQKTRASGSPSPVAGTVGGLGEVDGQGISARFAMPYGMAADKTGNVYVAEWAGSRIRKITADGQVTTFAGGTYYANPELVPIDGVGQAAQFDHPTGLAADDAGNIYVAENNRIRKITPNATVTTIAGAGAAGSAGNSQLDSQIGYTRCIAVDGSGNLYLTEENRVRKITPAGVITSLAGSSTEWGFADGTGDSARFFLLVGIAVDQTGNVFVADQGNRVIRKITASGVVTTLAGAPGIIGTDDGTGAAARFHDPSGLSIDRDGNLFVTDYCTIRKVTPSGSVSTVAGSPGIAGTLDGIGETACFHLPYGNIQGLAVGQTGKVYVADADTIRVGQLAGAPAISTQPKSQNVAPGDSVLFSVVAAGVPAPSYQWYFNGTAYPSATGSTLSFSNVRSSDAGDYSVVVTNSLGKVTSNPATLTLGSPSSSSPGPSSGGESSSGGGSINAWIVGILSVFGTLRLGRRYDARGILKDRQSGS